MNCALCSGVCAGVDLDPLLTSDLEWLWEAVAAAADRRGIEDMVSGFVSITAPPGAAPRSAVVGLIGGRALFAGQRRRVDLSELTRALAGRDANLTPGAVAAHAVGRRLAAKARERAAQDSAKAEIVDQLVRGLGATPLASRLDSDEVVPRLARMGWLARIRAQDDPAALISTVLIVLSRLPELGSRVDRRVLVPGKPHALDEGVLASLVLAICGVSGLRLREAWAELGVDIDDLVGGLIVTGVAPIGWVLPAGVTFTVPPKELVGIRWAGPPSPGEWLFVTENPSVLSAAVQTFRGRSEDGKVQVPRVVCTAGTPSQIECAAVAALTDAGWNVAVRADFDAAGLAHVRALLEVAPAARPWRMETRDYLASRRNPSSKFPTEVGASPWDPDLSDVMRETGIPAFEEDLLALLVGDILSGTPHMWANS